MANGPHIEYAITAPSLKEHTNEVASAIQNALSFMSREKVLDSFLARKDFNWKFQVLTPTELYDYLKDKDDISEGDRKKADAYSFFRKSINSECILLTDGLFSDFPKLLTRLSHELYHCLLDRKQDVLSSKARELTVLSWSTDHLTRLSSELARSPNEKVRDIGFRLRAFIAQDKANLAELQAQIPGFEVPRPPG